MTLLDLDGSHRLVHHRFGAMKVHITLVESVRHDSDARKRAFAELMSKFPLEDVNERRFERHGILSGEVDERCVSAIRKVDFVESIEADETKRAL